MNLKGVLDFSLGRCDAWISLKKKGISARRYIKSIFNYLTFNRRALHFMYPFSGRFGRTARVPGLVERSPAPAVNRHRSGGGVPELRHR
jgi:hypothetical protein